MRLLLDTHIAIWVVTNDRRLAAEATDLITNSRNVKLVSVVSLWEIGLKRSGPRGGVPFTAAEALPIFEEADFDFMDVTPDHAMRFDNLERRHGDPFDRMLVAQALHEQVPLMTHDKHVARYSDTFILV